MTAQIQDPGAHLTHVQPESNCQEFNTIQHVLSFPCKTPFLYNGVV